MQEVKVEGKRIKMLSMLNEEWPSNLKNCFLDKFLHSQYGHNLVNKLIDEVGEEEFLDKGVKPNDLFKKAIESIEETYDDFLLRMYLYRQTSEYRADDVDAVAIKDLSRMLIDVIEETGYYYEHFEYPKEHFLSKSNGKPVTSILIALYLEEIDCEFDDEFVALKELNYELLYDMPTLLFATSIRNIYKSNIEKYIQKELAAKNDLAKVNAVVEKQKENILKLKKTRAEASKEIREEYETKLKAVHTEKKKLENKITKLEKDLQKSQGNLTKVSQERDSYKTSFNKEVEKSANYEILKANLLKEKEEVQTIKREYAELLKNQQYEYTDRDWISGIFSIFMNNKEEMLKLYKESLMIMNNELNNHFNTKQTPIPVEQNKPGNDKTPISVIETQNTRTTKRKIASLKLVDNEWCVDNIKLNSLKPDQVLMENTFVIVDENNNLVFRLNSELVQNRPSYVATEDKNVFYCYFYKGKFFDADRVELTPVFKNSRKPIKDYQVLALNDKNEVLAVFPKTQLNVGKVIPYIKLNNLEVVVLKNKINDLAIVTNIFTQEDKVIKFDNLEEFQDGIEVDSTIIFKNNQIHTVFRSPLFYKMSEFFTEKETAIVVEVINGNHFVEKSNGEIVKIQQNYSEYHLSVNDVVLIDKDNNFLYREYYTEFDNSEEKPVNFRKKVKAFKEKTTTPITDSVLIIGNPKYKIGYEFGMKKQGVRAEVIDGYSTFYSIKKRANEHNNIVVVPNFVSHDNMFRIKEEFASKNVFYPEKDGVNYIYEVIFGAKAN